MKKLVAQNDNVVCIVEKESFSEANANGFIFKKPELPLYKIVDIGCNVKDDKLGLEVGDVVVTNSTGTLAIVDDVKYYMFKLENIAAKTNERE